MRYLPFIVLLFVVVACKKDTTAYKPTPYVLKKPSHFPGIDIPLNNPFTVEGIALGRKLFYEEKLSGDNTMSCASCHFPENSFSDPNQFSTGITGEDGTRNSMALVNMAYEKFFFWDGRASTLEEQILEPVPNAIELNESWSDAVAKLSKDQSYKNDFFKAFGVTTFDSTHVAKAIAQFIRTMISGSSKYDVMYKYENGLTLNPMEQAKFPSITNEEWAGYDLFKSLNGGDCIHCHAGALLQVRKFSNNGLDATFADAGRMSVTGKPSDEGKFKVPTLRNIALSAPYMHDGRFATLEEVLDHYSEGIQQSETIDPLIEFASQGGVQLDDFEKGLIIKFLNCLTDDEFLNNPKFKDPN